VAGGKGGALTISTGDIVIGGTASNALSLAANFFSTGGFSSYTLNSAGGSNGILVAPNTTVVATNQSLALNATDYKQASGSDINNFSTATVLPDWERLPVSVNLNLNANSNGIASGSLIVGAGASIKVDPSSLIKLTSVTQLTVLGTLDAPAGTIDLELNPISGANLNFSSSSIWLGSQSELLSQGVTMLTPNSTGLTQGQVLNGGTVKINSNVFFVAQQGALIDVSGTSAYLDLPKLSSGVEVYQKGLVAGNAGSVNISATEGAFLDGTMRASVDTSTAQAGSFSLTLTPRGTVATGTIFPSNTWELNVLPSGTGTFVTNGGKLPQNNSAATADFSTLDGMAYVDASTLKTAGFGQITLRNSNPNGSIVFADNANLQATQSITLDAPVIALSGNSASASVSSAYVNLANSTQFTQTFPVYAAPTNTAGTGTSFTVSGQLVDLTGAVLLSGIDQFTVKSTGDIRLNGVLNTNLNVAGIVNTATYTYATPYTTTDTTPDSLFGMLQTQGNITLQANQVYPTTMSQFWLDAPAGNITIQGHGSSPVLSAGGQVNLIASTIEQDGVLKAPMGWITLDGITSVNLGASSITSVSAAGETIPFGSIQGGSTWVYNLGYSQDGSANYVTISTPPAKQINISGNNIAITKGAVVDLSGGGDLYANEFIPGSGGAPNVLDPTATLANTFAIIPGISTLPRMTRN
jgi:filamentous hemagglutinin